MTNSLKSRTLTKVGAKAKAKTKAKTQTQTQALVLALALISITFLSSNNAKARLGETWDQCTTRYGADQEDDLTINLLKSVPLVTPGAQARWEVNGFIITIGWMAPEGPAGGADVVKVSKKKGSLTDGEISTLLEANSGGQTWKWKTTEIGNMWARDDGATAKPYQDTLGNVLIIFKSGRMTKKDIADLSIHKTKNEKASLPNF